MNKHTIMVGVAGREESDAAVRYATSDAQLRGLPVQVVHVIHPMLVDPSGDAAPAMLNTEPTWRAGSELLDETADRIRRQLGPEPQVTTRLIIGHPASALAEAGGEAAVIVLQPERMGRHRHVPTYSVTNAVAARSRRPVVAVPARWDQSAPAGVVTVGVDAADESAQLVQAAFEEAQSRSASLRVLHTWHYSDAYDDVVFPGSEKDAHSAALSVDLRTQLGPLADKFTDVPLDLDVRHGRAADELLRESTHSDLMIVGRHRTRRRHDGRHLGSIVRAVLRESRCPVMIVNPAAPCGGAEDDQA